MEFQLYFFLQTTTSLCHYSLILLHLYFCFQGKFVVQPSVFVTAKHNNPGLKRDACALWIEDVTPASCKVCMRELQNYAGSHRDIYVVSTVMYYLLLIISFL